MIVAKDTPDEIVLEVLRDQCHSCKQMVAKQIKWDGIIVLDKICLQCKGTFRVERGRKS